MEEKPSLANMREEYALGKLLESDADSNPIAQFEKWFQAAVNYPVKEPNIMILSTATADLQPHSRVVLLKDISPAGFTFFTNYESNKGAEIAGNNQVALTFIWQEMQRQVRIEGVASRLTPEASDAYFYSRPLESQVGAVVSAQSKVLQSRDELDLAYEKLLNDAKNGQKVARPAHWGGYLVTPNAFEFWQGRASRLHDRLLYKTSSPDNWTIARLSP